MANREGDVTIRLEGLDETIAMLRKARRRGANLVPAFRIIDKSFTMFQRRQFLSSGRIGGTPWPPLAPSTKRSRLRGGGNRGGVDRPLWDTNRLRASMLSGSGEGFKKFSRHTWERGTTVPYAHFHQPTRPIIPERMPRFIVRSWTRTLRRHFERRGRL